MSCKSNCYLRILCLKRRRLEVFSKFQKLLAAFEHNLYVPAFSILTENFVFVHICISAEDADPLSGIGSVWNIHKSDGYPFKYPAIFLHKQVDIYTQLPFCFAAAFTADCINRFDVHHLTFILVVLFRVRFQSCNNCQTCLFTSCEIVPGVANQLSNAIMLAGIPAFTASQAKDTTRLLAQVRAILRILPAKERPSVSSLILPLYSLPL